MPGPTLLTKAVAARKRQKCSDSLSPERGLLLHVRPVPRPDLGVAPCMRYGNMTSLPCAFVQVVENYTLGGVLLGRGENLLKPSCHPPIHSQCLPCTCVQPSCLVGVETSLSLAGVKYPLLSEASTATTCVRPWPGYSSPRDGTSLGKLACMER